MRCWVKRYVTWCTYFDFSFSSPSQPVWLATSIPHLKRKLSGIHRWACRCLSPFLSFPLYIAFSLSSFTPDCTKHNLTPSTENAKIFAKCRSGILITLRGKIELAFGWEGRVTCAGNRMNNVRKWSRRRKYIAYLTLRWTLQRNT